MFRPNALPIHLLISVSWILGLALIPTLGQATPTPLQLGKPIERQIKGGETHSFQFDVKAGHYARVEVEQKNIDVIVSLFSPDGKLVVDMDGKDGRMWRESLSAVSEKGGTYRLEISSYGTTERSGNYTAKLGESRQSEPNDRKRLDAEMRFSAGRKFLIQGGANFQSALKEFEAAANLWHEVNDPDRGDCPVQLWGRLYRSIKVRTHY